MGKKKAIAGIAIYGAPHCGHGYIASAPDGRMFGDGEPHGEWGATSALWNAEADLRNAGFASGPVEVSVDAAAGPLMALGELGKLPSFGGLKWGPGRVYVISAEAILAAAAKE